MITLPAKNLTLQETFDLFDFQVEYDGRFEPLLNLDPITELEQQELLQTRSDFQNHLLLSRASEGQVKLVVVGPLLRLAGFYQYPLKMQVEEGINRIEIRDELGDRDITVTGRFDLLAINQAHQAQENIPFWVLVVESKESSVSPTVGLPQLLAYAYGSLQYQKAVWGLMTNGEYYQFVQVRATQPPSYQYMPILNLMDLQSATVLLQVLKAICQQQL
jgi:hypothetical protein